MTGKTWAQPRNLGLIIHDGRVRSGQFRDIDGLNVDTDFASSSIEDLPRLICPPIEDQQIPNRRKRTPRSRPLHSVLPARYEAPPTQKNANARISMLSRGLASGGLDGSSKAVWAV